MSDTAATVTVTMRASPLAAWFHHLLTTPVLQIDGRTHPARWGSQPITLAPGTHRVAVYFRYHGQHTARLAEAERQITVPLATPRLALDIRLGPLNASTFRIADPTPR